MPTIEEEILGPAEEDNVNPVLDMIASAEGTNGNYSARGRSGEYGKYQYMPDTWRSWSSKHFGKVLEPTPENQDLVAQAQVKEWRKQGYSDEQILRMWNSGQPDKAKKGVNAQGVAYDTEAYVQRGMGGNSGQQAKGGLSIEEQILGPEEGQEAQRRPSTSPYSQIMQKTREGLASLSEGPATPPAPAERGAIGEVGAAVGRGLFQAANTVTKAANTLGLSNESTEIVLDYIHDFQDKWAGKLDKTKQGEIWDYVNDVFENTAQSVAAGTMLAVPAAAAGAGFGLFGAVPGAVAGFAVGAGGAFGLAEYYDFMQDVKKAGIDPEKLGIKRDAVLSALAEGGFEAMSDLIAAATFGLVGKVASAPVKAGLLKALGRFIGRTAVVMGSESSTEMATAAAETALRTRAGVPGQPTPGAAAMQAGPVAAGQGALMSVMGGALGAMAGSHRTGKREVKQAFNDKLKQQVEQIRAEQAEEAKITKEAIPWTKEAAGTWVDRTNKEWAGYGVTVSQAEGEPGDTLKVTAALSRPLTIAEGEDIDAALGGRFLDPEAKTYEGMDESGRKILVQFVSPTPAAEAAKEPTQKEAAAAATMKAITEEAGPAPAAPVTPPTEAVPTPAPAPTAPAAAFTGPVVSGPLPADRIKTVKMGNLYYGYLSSDQGIDVSVAEEKTEAKARKIAEEIAADPKRLERLLEGKLWIKARGDVTFGVEEPAATAVEAPAAKPAPEPVTPYAAVKTRKPTIKELHEWENTLDEEVAKHPGISPKDYHELFNRLWEERFGPQPVVKKAVEEEVLGPKAPAAANLEQSLVAEFAKDGMTEQKAVEIAGLIRSGQYTVDDIRSYYAGKKKAGKAKKPVSVSKKQPEAAKVVGAAKASPEPVATKEEAKPAPAETFEQWLTRTNAAKNIGPVTEADQAKVLDAMQKAMAVAQKKAEAAKTPDKADDALSDFVKRVEEVTGKTFTTETGLATTEAGGVVAPGPAGAAVTTAKKPVSKKPEAKAVVERRRPVGRPSSGVPNRQDRALAAASGMTPEEAMAKRLGGVQKTAEAAIVGQPVQAQAQAPAPAPAPIPTPAPAPKTPTASSPGFVLTPAQHREKQLDKWSSDPAWNNAKDLAELRNHAADALALGGVKSIVDADKIRAAVDVMTARLTELGYKQPKKPVSVKPTSKLRKGVQKNEGAKVPATEHVAEEGKAVEGRGVGQNLGQAAAGQPAAEAAAAGSIVGQQAAQPGGEASWRDGVRAKLRALAYSPDSKGQRGGDEFVGRASFPEDESKAVADAAIRGMVPSAREYLLNGHSNIFGGNGMPIIYVSDDMLEMFPERHRNTIETTALCAYCGDVVLVRDLSRMSVNSVTHELTHIVRDIMPSKTRKKLNEHIDSLSAKLFKYLKNSDDPNAMLLLSRMNDIIKGFQFDKRHAQMMRSLGQRVKIDLKDPAQRRGVEFVYDLRVTSNPSEMPGMTQLGIDAGVLGDVTGMPELEVNRAVICLLHNHIANTTGVNPYLNLSLNFESESQAYIVGQDPALAEEIFSDINASEKAKVTTAKEEILEGIEGAKASSIAKQTAAQTSPTQVQTVQPGTSPNTPVNIRTFGMPELVQLAKELRDGKLDVSVVPGLTAAKGAKGRFSSKTGNIKLSAELFNNTSEAAATFGHEIGHMADWLEQKLIGIPRGNILGRIASLFKFMKYDYQTLAREPDIRAELKSVTQAYKPFDETENAGYTRYRYSSSELYADAFSVLVNDPALLKQLAPKFTEGFFDYLYRKPTVKRIYDEIQSHLTDEDTTALWRLALLDKSVARAEDALNEQMKVEKKSWKEQLKSAKAEAYFAIIDKRERLITAVDNLTRAGIHIDPQHNPLYWTEELPYIDNLQFRYWRKVVNEVYDEFKSLGISDEDRSVYLKMNRAVEYLSKGKAFPGGHTLDSATGVLEKLRDRIGADKFHQMGMLQKKLTDIRREHVLPYVERAGLVNAATMKEMMENESYVTFFDARYVDQLFNDQGMPREMRPQVYQIVGNLNEDLVDPLLATVLKDQALLRAAHVKMTAMFTFNTLRENFGADEVIEAKRIGKMGFASPPAGYDTIMVLDKGKLKGYYVRSKIAAMFKNNPSELNQINKIISVMQNAVKGIFVRYNPVWVIRNLIRDTLDTYKKVPGVTMPKLFKTLLTDSWRDAKLDVYNNFSTSDVDEMYKGMMLVCDRAYRHLEADDGISHIEKLVYAYGMRPQEAQKKQMRFYESWLDKMDKFGKFTERVNKIAAYKITKANMEKWKAEEARLAALPNRSKGQERKLQEVRHDLGTVSDPKMLAHMIRTRAGTPDIYRAGSLSWLYNNIWLFSNVNKEGWRAHLEAAREDKWTSSEYLYKTVKVTILPKTVMMAAAVGMLGDWWKKWVNNISEYNKGAYTILPLGMTNKGESVYIRVPPDYGGQFLGSLFWRGINLMYAQTHDKDYRYNPDEWKSIFDFSLDSQPYGSLHPLLGVLMDGVELLRGNNPYDSFTGKQIVPDYIAKARDWRTAEAFGKYAWNKMGLRPLHTFKSETVPYIEQEFYERFADKVPFLGPMAWTYVQVSDYGKRQRYDWVSTEAEKNDFRRLADRREGIWDSIKEVIDSGRKPSAVAAQKLYREMVRGGIVDQKTTSWRNFWHTYNRYASRTYDNRELDAIVFARNNNEKAMLLTEYKKTMDGPEYSRILNQLLREGHVTSETMAVMKRMKK